MSSVFVSYRRVDSSGSAGRLFDRLADRWGRAAVFMDIEGSIPRGDDFPTAIMQALDAADAILVVIGPRWLTCTDAMGASRLSNSDDWVRNEVEGGLRRGIPVLPVLVDGASMPAVEDLPPSLRSFARRHASEISNSRWTHDVGEIVKRLEPPLVPIVNVPAPSRTKRLIVVATCFALAIGYAVQRYLTTSSLATTQTNAPPLIVSFDVWQDLGRPRSELNVVKLSNEYVATVIYGSGDLDVRDIDVNTVYLSDGTGSGVPAAMFHLSPGYDENKDGKDDLKLDYRIADLKSSANKLYSESTFQLAGRLKASKGARPIRGERSVAVFP